MTQSRTRKSRMIKSRTMKVSDDQVSHERVSNGQVSHDYVSDDQVSHDLVSDDLVFYDVLDDQVSNDVISNLFNSQITNQSFASISTPSGKVLIDLTPDHIQHLLNLVLYQGNNDPSSNCNIPHINNAPEGNSIFLEAQHGESELPDNALAETHEEPEGDSISLEVQYSEAELPSHVPETRTKMEACYSLNIVRLNCWTILLLKLTRNLKETQSR